MQRNPRSILLPSLCLLSLLVGCGGEEDTAPVAIATHVSGEGRLVKTQLLGVDDQGDGIQLPATVAATSRAELAFQVSGPLVELAVREGQQVKQGDLLARIDPRDFDNAVALTEARLQADQRLFERYQKLMASPQSPVSQAQVDQTRRDFETSRADHEQAQKRLRDTQLLAPFDGTVAARYVDNYQNVQAKETVLLLESTNNVDILVDVPADLIGRREKPAQPGDEVGAVTFAGFPDQAFPVRLKEFSTRADNTTQTFRATLTLPRPEGLNVLAGMNATVSTRLASDPGENAFWIPDTALVDDSGNPQVWVVDEEAMTVSPRPVQIDESRDGQSLVVEGLQSGERIIAAGASQLNPGDRVRIYRAGMLGT